MNNALWHTFGVLVSWCLGFAPFNCAIVAAVDIQTSSFDKTTRELFVKRCSNGMCGAIIVLVSNPLPGAPPATQLILFANFFGDPIGEIFDSFVFVMSHRLEFHLGPGRFRYLD